MRDNEVLEPPQDRPVLLEGNLAQEYRVVNPFMSMAENPRGRAAVGGGLPRRRPGGGYGRGEGGVLMPAVLLVFAFGGFGFYLLVFG